MLTVSIVQSELNVTENSVESKQNADSKYSAV